MSNCLLVKNATLIDVKNGAKSINDILIRGDKVHRVAIAGSLEVQAGMSVVDATGRYVIPGLWEMHTHLTAWPDVPTRQMSALFVAAGVTNVRDMGARLEDILAFRQESARMDAAPRVWFAGPFINSAPDYGSHMSVTADTPEQARHLVNDLAKVGIHFVKPYEMLKPDVFEAIVKRAQELNLKASGHVPTRMTIAEVLEMTPYDIQHLGGTCSGMRYDCACSPHLRDERVAFLSAREDSATSGIHLFVDLETSLKTTFRDQDRGKREQLIQLFVDKKTWHTPTLSCGVHLRDLGLENSTDRQEPFRYLPKGHVDTWRKNMAEWQHIFDKRYEWGPWQMETVGEMFRAGVPFLAGTDCPAYHEFAPGFALHFEMVSLVKAGLSSLAALQSATINPARFFDVESEYGSIEPGKYADMLLLNADPLEDINHTRRIDSVILSGRPFDRGSLDRILESIDY